MGRVSCVRPMKRMSRRQSTPRQHGTHELRTPHVAHEQSAITQRQHAACELRTPYVVHEQAAAQTSILNLCKKVCASSVANRLQLTPLHTPHTERTLVQRILVARVHVLHHALVHPAQVAGRHVLAHALFHEACGAHHCLGLVDLAHTKVGVGQPHGQLGVIVVGPHQLAECVGPLELHLWAVARRGTGGGWIMLRELLALVDLGLLERSRRVLGRILDEIEDLLVDLDKQQAVMREALLKTWLRGCAGRASRPGGPKCSNRSRPAATALALPQVHFCPIATALARRNSSRSSSSALLPHRNRSRPAATALAPPRSLLLRCNRSRPSVNNLTPPQMLSPHHAVFDKSPYPHVCRASTLPQSCLLHVFRVPTLPQRQGHDPHCA
eukprot:362011-Chlamydomonas_euryale.AAC.4